MSEQCAARLYDSRMEVRCRRNSRHYSKPHKATATWMASIGRLVDAEVTWPVDADEWELPAEDAET